MEHLGKAKSGMRDAPQGWLDYWSKRKRMDRPTRQLLTEVWRDVYRLVLNDAATACGKIASDRDAQDLHGVEAALECQDALLRLVGILPGDG